MRYVLVTIMLVLTAVTAEATPYNNGMNHDRAYPNYRPSQNAQRQVIAPRRAQARQRQGTSRRQSTQARLSPAIAREAGAQIGHTITGTVTRAASGIVRVATEILPHPSGCPRRAFCGCGAAVKVFGSPVRSLWLAANWLKFPRAAPAPGMVAARRGHVFVIEAVLGNGKVIAYDANSGRGQTRRHVRSLAGFTIVNPRA